VAEFTDLKNLSNKGQRIPHRSVNLGNATKGISILDLRTELMGLSNLTITSPIFEKFLETASEPGKDVPLILDRRR